MAKKKNGWPKGPWEAKDYDGPFDKKDRRRLQRWLSDVLSRDLLYPELEKFWHARPPEMDRIWDVLNTVFMLSNDFIRR
jgi:hypothetical protein